MLVQIAKAQPSLDSMTGQFSKSRSGAWDGKRGGDDISSESFEIQTPIVRFAAQKEDRVHV